MDALACVLKDGEMLAKLGGAAAGQDGDDFLLWIEIMLAAKARAISRGMHGANQWVADEFHGDAGVTVELFFKGEDTKRLCKAAADYADAPRTPGPELRADVIDIAYAVRLEFSGEAQVEAGEIGEDGEGGFATLGFVDEAAHGANQGGKVAEDFGDADDGDFGIVGDDVDAGGAHLRTAHTENF